MSEENAPSGESQGDKPHYLGHRERLRQRFAEAPQSLPDYEVLELLLMSSIPRRDVKPMAKSLIQRFGSLADVLAADHDALVRIGKLGPATAATIMVVREAAIRLARAPVIERPVLAAWTQLIDYCNTAMAAAPTEQFRLLFLDRKNVLIADELQQKGTVDHTPVYPREVVKRALELHASALIMM